MRTENPSSLSATMARIQDRLVRTGRFARAQGPLVRWTAALGVLAVLAGIGYLTTLPAAGKFLGGAQQYSADEVIKITRTLDAGGIDYRVEDRRIGVASDRFDEAMKLVSKLGLGPRSPSDIRNGTDAGGLWEPLSERDHRALKVEEEILEAMIDELDGVASAYVTINRPKARAGVRPVPAGSAFVWLETEDDRELGLKTVQTIQNIIVGHEPDLKPAAISVFDKKGRRYSGDEVQNALLQTGAREEELRQKILDQLDWVKGVRVTVQIVPAPVLPPAPAAAPEPPPQPTARIVVNHGMALEADPSPSPPKPDPPPPPSRAAVETDLARVWVQVPRSFYYFKALPNRVPSLDDLQPIVARTESLIRTAVGHIVPPGESGEIVIDTIPDDMVLKALPVPPSVPETHRTPSWVIPAVVGGAVMAALLIVGFRMLATRRPRAVSPPERERTLNTRDGAPEPIRGPTERVRELIRRDPEAAAGVLHRWIGQGGSLG